MLKGKFPITRNGGLSKNKQIVENGTHQATKASFVLSAKENCNRPPLTVSICLPVQYCYFKTFRQQLPTTVYSVLTVYTKPLLRRELYAMENFNKRSQR